MTRSINGNEFIGKRIALVLWQAPDDAAYGVGTVAVRDGAYSLEFTDGTAPFPLRTKWFPRLQKGSSETDDIFDGAEYILSLSVGELPDNTASSELTSTGMRWPNKDE